MPTPAVFAPAAPGLPRVHSVSVVADVLGVHPDTLLKEIHAGRLHATKVGRQYRITDADVRDYLAADAQ